MPVPRDSVHVLGTSAYPIKLAPKLNYRFLSAEASISSTEVFLFLSLCSGAGHVDRYGVCPADALLKVEEQL